MLKTPYNVWLNTQNAIILALDTHFLEIKNKYSQQNRCSFDILKDIIRFALYSKKLIVLIT